MHSDQATDFAALLLVLTGILIYFRRDTGLPTWAIMLLAMTMIVGATTIVLVAR